MRRMCVTLLLSSILLLLAGCGGEQPPADSTPAESAAEVPRRDSAAPTTSGNFSKPETTGPCAGVPVELCDIAGPESTSAKPSDLPLVTIDAGGPQFDVRVEIADDEAERQRGLMERTTLPKDAGMLFVFGREQELSFWMRNTRIPLSIAYIDADGRIVDIEDMEPFDDQTKHPSAEPSKYALEVNQGFFEERSIEVGDRVEVPAEYR